MIRLQKGFGTIVVLPWKSSHLVTSQNIMIQLQKGFGTIAYGGCHGNLYIFVKSQNIMIRLQKGLDSIAVFVM